MHQLITSSAYYKVRTTHKGSPYNKPTYYVVRKLDKVLHTHRLHPCQSLAVHQLAADGGCGGGVPDIDFAAEMALHDSAGHGALQAGRP